MDVSKTFGQEMVSWNPNYTAIQEVNDIKQKYADIIDAMNEVREQATDSEVIRMASIAITEAQTASMWAVKTLTWGK